LVEENSPGVEIGRKYHRKRGLMRWKRREEEVHEM
jgi:hypothetical protein